MPRRELRLMFMPSCHSLTSTPPHAPFLVVVAARGSVWQLASQKVRSGQITLNPGSRTHDDPAGCPPAGGTRQEDRHQAADPADPLSLTVPPPGEASAYPPASLRDTGNPPRRSESNAFRAGAAGSARRHVLFFPPRACVTLTYSGAPALASSSSSACCAAGAPRQGGTPRRGA